jgi:hypothetical protein
LKTLKTTTSVFKLLNYPITQLLNGKEIWLSASQGLRGSDSGVVWRRENEPVALETRHPDDEMKKS